MLYMEVEDMTGEMMKQLRLHLDLSQKEFGERFGASRDMVANIENDRVEIKDILLRHIVSVFHLKEEWATSGKGEMFQDEADDFVSELVAKYNLDPLQQSLVRAVYEMPQEYRTMILTLARRLVAENEEAPEETDEDRTKRIIRAARAANDTEADQDADKRA